MFNKNMLIIEIEFARSIDIKATFVVVKQTEVDSRHGAS